MCSPTAPGWSAEPAAAVGALLSCRAERLLAGLPLRAGDSEMPGCGSAPFVLRGGRERRRSAAIDSIEVCGPTTAIRNTIRSHRLPCIISCFYMICLVGINWDHRNMKSAQL